MSKEFRQEFSIKSIPTDDTLLLENTLNAMSNSGWELYSIYEAEQNNKIVYNCIFVKEIQISNDDMQDDIINFRSSVERMLYSKEEPYELCVGLQRKIREKKEKIERVKQFLENSKDEERELLNQEIKRDIDDLNDLKRDLKEISSPSKMSKFLGEEKLSISLESGNYCLCDIANADNLLAQIVKTRQDITQELGYIIPKVKFIEDNSLDECAFTINIHGTKVMESKAYPNHYAFFEDELNIDKIPKNSKRVKDPLIKRKIVWIKDEYCKDYWLKGLEPSEYIVSYLAYCIISHIEEIFDYKDLNRYVEFVGDNNEFLIDSILGDFVSISELKYILVQLLREKVSIKDIVFIFEKLNDFSYETSKIDILDKLRMSLSRQISQKYADKNNKIPAFELSDEMIALLERQSDFEEGCVKLELSKFSKFKKNLKENQKDILESNAVIIAPQKFRQIVFILASRLFLDVAVLCYEEINPDYELEILGKI